MRTLKYLYLLLLPSLLFGKVIYVNVAYTGGVKDGQTWNTPFTKIGDAINAADPDDQIWVAKGEYSVDTTLDGKWTPTVLSKNLNLYGGFVGTETSIFTRDLELNKVVLNGAKRTFFFCRTDANLLVDGFEFTNFGVGILGQDTLGNTSGVRLKVTNCNFYNGNNPIVFSDADLFDLQVSNSSFTKINSALPLYQKSNGNLSNASFTNVNFFEIGYASGFIPSGRVNLKYESCSFNNNAGYVVDYEGGSSAFINCKFFNNTANYLIISQGNNLEVTNCEFKGNIVSGQIVINNARQASLIKNVEVVDNKAGYFIQTNPSTTISLKVLNSNFVNNSFKGGSAIFGGASNVSEITDCKFESNKSEGYPSCIYNYEPSVFKITNSSFKNNASKFSSGGGSILSYSGLDIDKCYFENNVANHNPGGAICSRSNRVINISNCEFKNNIDSSSQGGGAIWSADVALNLSNTNFDGNRSFGIGGSLRTGGNTKILNSKFSNSWAGGEGGAIYCYSLNEYYNTEFVNNYSDNNGGAIGSIGVNTKLYNCNFFNNSAKNSGGVFSGAYGNFKSYNCTFVKNRSLTNTWNIEVTYSGGSSSPGGTYKNCILWNNGEGNAIQPFGDVTYSNIQGGYPGEGNLDIDPQFVDEENGNLRLSCSSPLINKGSNEFVEALTDLEGKQRIFAGTVDMGAYEFPQDPAAASSPPTVSFASPLEACKNEVITFVNNTTPFENTKFEWNFGDGSTSNEIAPTYKFPFAGTYTITLKATNICGASATTNKTITIKPSFSPSITYPTVVCPGQTSSFTTDAACTNLVWQVQGGSVVTGQNTKSITVLWGDGKTGNGKVTLLATACGGNFCEQPVVIDIPIVPVNFSLTGPTKVCLGATGVYKTQVENETPGTIYTWRVKNGTFSSTNRGYNLFDVTINWSSNNNDTVGKVYLTTYNEVLDCGRTDSFKVLLRPKFTVSGNSTVCESANSSFGTSLSGRFFWNVQSPNIVDTISFPQVKWGNIAGKYNVSALALDVNNFCNLADTFNVEVIKLPTLTAISGEQEVIKNTSYVYSASVTPSNANFSWNVEGGFVTAAQGNQATIVFNTYPYKIRLNAFSNNCSSTVFERIIDSAYVFKLSGLDTICITEPVTITGNVDPNNATTYTWLSNGQGTAANNSYSVSFGAPGVQTVTANIERKGKTISVQKNVFVRASVTSLSITGETTIDPAGTGTYSYTVNNPLNLNYTFTTIGASASSKTGNIISVTWNGTGPFTLTVNAKATNNPCLGVPVILEAKKAPSLATSITTNGSPCLNSRVTYTYDTDQLTKNLVWSISGGGTKVGEVSNGIIVEWGSTAGNYSVSVSYQRYGNQLVNIPVLVNPLPNPQVNDGTICGTRNYTLGTSSTFNAYEWTLEGSTTIFSTSSNPVVNTEGLYKVKVTDQNGCQALGSKYIKQIPLPKVKVLTDDANGYCLGTGAVSLTLKTFEGNGYSYQWYRNDVPLNETQSIAVVGVDRATVSTTRFKVKTTNQGCEETSNDFSVFVQDCSGGGGGGGGNPCLDPPVSFTVSNATCQPFAIDNTSSSTNGFLWNFGDGTTSSVTEPGSKVYSDVGPYQITLTRGCQSATAKVNVPAIAIFKLESPSCTNNNAIFKDYSVNIPGYSIKSWRWNFGDKDSISGTSNIRDITHVYKDTGSFTVKLRIVSEDNATKQICESEAINIIKITARPNVKFNVVNPACTNDVYTFNNTSIVATTDAKYLWNFGNGNTSALKNPSQQYTAAGFQNVSLQITDLFNCQASISQQVQTYTPIARGEISVTGNTLLCNGNNVVLTSPTGSSYQWSRNNVLLSPISQALTVTTAGVYKVTYQNPICAITTKEVEVKEFSLSNKVVANSKLCEGDPITLSTGIDPSVYSLTWRQNSTTLANTEPFLNIPSLGSINSGSYIVTVKKKDDGCILNLPSYAVVVNSKPEKPSLTLSKSSICYNDSVTINTNVSIISGKRFLWSRDNQLLPDSSRPKYQLVSLTSTADYKLTVKDISSGCTIISDNIRPNVSNNIVVALSGTNNICEGTATSISTPLSTNDFTFSWTKNNLAISNSGPNISLANVLLGDAGSYVLTAVSKGTTNLVGCSAKSPAYVLDVKAAPAKPSISGADQFCTGSNIVLTSSVGTNIRWNTQQTTAAINISLGGSYTVTATNTSNGCTSSATKTVIENPSPDLSFFTFGVYERCGNVKVDFEALKNFPSYQWKLNGQPYGSANSILYPRETGKYNLAVTTDKGCIGNSDTMRITSLDCPCFVTNTNDVGDGSLREAINCANSKPGFDKIKFAIPASPYIITPATALPIINETVEIDGFSQNGSGNFAVVLDGSVFKKNALVFANNVDASSVTGLTFRKFENSILLNDLVDNTIIDSNIIEANEQSAITIRQNTTNNKVVNNTISSTGNAITLESNSRGNEIKDNIISSAQVGIGVYSNSSQNRIYNNQISNTSEEGLLILTSSSNNEIKGNTIFKAQKNAIRIDLRSRANIIDSNFVGLDKLGSSQINSLNGIFVAGNAIGSLIRRNTVGNSTLHGIYSAATFTSIVDNFVGVTKANSSAPNQLTGIMLVADSATVLKNSVNNNLGFGIDIRGFSTVRDNVVQNNALGGINVVRNRNKISRNIITNTNPAVKAIQLNLATSQPGNLSKAPASITTYRRTTSGLILTGQTVPNDSVEVFYNNSTGQQAIAYLGTSRANSTGLWELAIAEGTYFNPSTKNYYVNTATSMAPNTSELSSPQMIGCFGCICTVTNTNDAGENSLRAAVDSAHTGRCLTVNFNIASPDTIRLVTQIRDLNVPIKIDGPQSGIDPSIWIKGTNNSNGFNLKSNGVTIGNLSMVNFKTALQVDGNFATIQNNNLVKSIRPINLKGNNNILTSNCINCNENGSNTHFVDSALVITGSNNVVGQQNLGNRIVNARNVGLAVNKGLSNSLLYNSFEGAVYAIKLLNSGNALKARPFDLSSSFVGTVATVAGKAGANDRIQLFRSDIIETQTASPYVIETNADANGNWSVTLPNTFVFSSNAYLVVTATSSIGNTSELSDLVRVGNFPQVCYVTNTLNEGKGSLRTAVDCANRAGLGANGSSASVVFQLPVNPNTISLESGLTITNNFGVNIDAELIPVTLTAVNNTPTAFSWNTNFLTLANLNFNGFSTPLVTSGNTATIRNNQFSAYNTALNITNGSQNIVNNYFGDGKFPVKSTNATVQLVNNFIGRNKDQTPSNIQGIAINIASGNNSQILNNVIERVQDSAIVIANASNVQIIGNTLKAIPNTTHKGIVLSNISNVIIRNDSIRGYETGVLLNNVVGGGIDGNYLSDISNIGFNLLSSTKVDISKNLVVGLPTGGYPIRLNYNTPTQSNNGKIKPYVVGSTYRKGELFIRGRANPFDKVEIYRSSNGVDLTSFVKTIDTDGLGVWEYTEKMPVDKVKDAVYRGTGSLNSETSEASDKINYDLRVCLVKNNNDDGDFSLRKSIVDANIGVCNYIGFEIGTGAATIPTISQLPPITATKLTIDGTSQPGFLRSPLVSIAGEQTRGFIAKNTNELNIHSMAVVGYDTSLVIKDINSYIIDNSAMALFNQLGIYTSNISTSYGELAGDTIIGDAINSIGIFSTSPGLKILRNSFTGSLGIGIVASADTQYISLNKMDLPYLSNVIGITSIANNKTTIIENNIIRAGTGIRIYNTTKTKIFANQLGKLSNTTIMKGIYAYNCEGCSLQLNGIRGQQIGIKVSNSKESLISLNSIDTSATAIRLDTCNHLEVSNNRINKVDLGIDGNLLIASELASNSITSNRVSGIQLSFSSLDSLFKNSIGGSTFLPQVVGQGYAISLLNSDNNVIGKLKGENKLFRNLSGAVLVDKGINNLITHNVFYENDVTRTRPQHFAISLKNNGNGAKKRPTIVDHYLASDRSSLLISGQAEANDSVHIYTGNGGYEEVRRWVGTAFADGLGRFETIVSNSVKNDSILDLLESNTFYLVATATNPSFNTSPLSDMYILGDCYVTSVADTSDNEYPYPNSLRMAVKCVNGQRQKVSLNYRISDGGDEIRLQTALQPLINSFGFNYNGLDQLSRQPTAISKITANPDTLAWTFDGKLGSSVVNDLKIKDWSSGIKVASDSLIFDSLMARGIIKHSIILENSADKVGIRNSTFFGGKVAILSNGASELVTQNNRFDNLDYGLLAGVASSSVSVKSSVFKNIRNEAVNIANHQDVSISNNIFGTSLENQKMGLKLTNCFGTNRLAYNTFAALFAGSDALQLDRTTAAIVNNNFSIESDANAISLLSCVGSRVDSNNFTMRKGNAVFVKNGHSNFITKNGVVVTENHAFNLESSDSNKISRNTVVGTSKTMKCIHLNYGNTLQSNEGKQPPKFFPISHAIKVVNTRRGLVLRGTAVANDSIEVFLSDSLQPSMNEYWGTTYAGQDGVWEFVIPREKLYADTIKWYHLVATATKTTKSTSETDTVYHIPPTTAKFFVLNRNNKGPNSLRDALEQVNLCDLRSRVIFNIGEADPYRIVLDSVLEPINSYKGFTMDGKTQELFAGSLSPDKRIYVDFSNVTTGFGFDLVSDCDSSSIMNMTLENARAGLRVSNGSNNINNLKMLNRTTSKLDTAMIIFGSSNGLANNEISGYKNALVLTKTEKNKVNRLKVSNSHFGILLNDTSANNDIVEADISTIDSIAVKFSRNAGTGNLLKKSKLNGLNGIGVLLDSTAGQIIIGNELHSITPYSNQTTASLVKIKGNAEFNVIFQNQIGYNDKLIVPFAGYGISIEGGSNAKATNNNINENHIGGASLAFISSKWGNSNIFTSNLLGDTAKGVVSTQPNINIEIADGLNESVENNILTAYTENGIDVKRSDFITIARNSVYSLSDNKAIDLNKGTVDASNKVDAALVIEEPIIDNLLTVIDTSSMEIKGTAQYANADIDLFVGNGKEQSLKYIGSVRTDNSKSWKYTLFRNSFTFDDVNYFVAQLSQNFRSSELSRSIEKDAFCDLAALSDSSLIDDVYNPCPAIGFKINPNLGKNLKYSWTLTSKNLSTPQVLTFDTPSIIIKDTTYHIDLVVSNAAGNCSIRDTALLNFRVLPFKPDFILRDSVKVGDTLVVVDISPDRNNNPFTWSTSAGTNVIKTSRDTVVGPDGKTYPKDRFIELVFPQKGAYEVKQISQANGCFFNLSKIVNAVDKKVKRDDPIQQLLPTPETFDVLVNPVVDGKIHFQAEVASIEPVDIQIYNGQGVILKSFKLNGKTKYKAELSVELPASVYMIQFRTKYTTFTKKIVINN